MTYATVPVSVKRPWGSIELPDGSRAGEIWHLCDSSSASSTLIRLGGARGPEAAMRDTSVRCLVESGVLPGWSGGYFPLLVKTLHTSDALSIQVHPGLGSPAVARRKDETWLILGARPGSWLLCGLESGVDRSSLSGALEAGRPEECLRRYEPAAGDLYHVPAGCVHCLGPGLEVLEIQRNFDVTYRLYDWGRPGLDGRPRELHLERGLDSVSWGEDESARMPTPREGEPAVVSPPDAGYRLRFPGGEPILQGSGTLAFFVRGHVPARIPGEAVSAAGNALLVSDGEGNGLDGPEECMTVLEPLEEGWERHER